MSATSINAPNVFEQYFGMKHDKTIVKEAKSCGEMDEWWEEREKRIGCNTIVLASVKRMHANTTGWVYAIYDFYFG